jgi:hypothetical protein
MALFHKIYGTYAVTHPLKMSDTAEGWKEIRGYEGHHWVSNKGQVKSIFRVLKETITKSGHARVHLSHMGVPKGFAVHRLVAEAFVEGEKAGLVVDHIDRNPANNKASNLRWVTQRENCWNKKDKANMTGFKHVTKRGNRYTVSISRTIGSYDTPEEAHAAAIKYLETEDRFYKMYSHMKTSLLPDDKSKKSDMNTS